MSEQRDAMDVRDEALGAALAPAADPIEAIPADRLPEVLRRGSRRRVARFTAIGAAVAVFAGAVAWAGLSLPSNDAAIPADTDDWRTFASLGDNGWTIQVPPPWHITQLPACDGAEERIGAVVTNVPFEFRDPQGGSPDCGERLVMAGFPRDGVALGFYPIVGDSLPGFGFEAPDTVLPLTPGLLVQTGGIRGGPSESYQGIWQDRDWIGTIRRFVGPDASIEHVTAIDRMLASFTVAGAPRWDDREIVGPRGVRVTVRVPPNWRTNTFPAAQGEDVPQPIARLASPPVEDGHCPDAPEAMGFDSLGDTGTVIVVYDAAGAFIGGDIGPRPDPFDPKAKTEVIELQCGAHVRVMSFLFLEDGRPILIQVAKTRFAYNDNPELLGYVFDRISVSGP